MPVTKRGKTNKKALIFRYLLKKWQYIVIGIYEHLNIVLFIDLMNMLINIFILFQQTDKQAKKVLNEKDRKL